MYKKGKTIYYEKRREKFIRDIQGDFRDTIIPSMALKSAEAGKDLSVPEESMVSTT